MSSTYSALYYIYLICTRPTLPPIDQAFDGNLVCIQFDVFILFLFLFFWKGGGAKRFASSQEMEDRLLLIDDFLPANSPVSGDAQVYPLQIKQTYHLKTEMERNGLINLKRISVPKKIYIYTTTRNQDVIHYSPPYLQQPSRKPVLLWCRQGSPSARPYHEGVEYRAAMLLPSVSARDSAVWSALSPAVLYSIKLFSGCKDRERRGEAEREETLSLAAASISSPLPPRCTSLQMVFTGNKKKKQRVLRAPSSPALNELRVLLADRRFAFYSTAAKWPSPVPCKTLSMCCAGLF